MTEKHADRLGLVFVQLRLPPWVAEALRAAGARNRRKLPSEIIYRLVRELEAMPAPQPSIVVQPDEIGEA